MAKGINMVGKFRGKVGAMVFRTEAGIGQIASEYNPNPKNPRTLAQTRQRVKMSLAGMISKAIPANLLVGLDPNGRTARSMFVSNILKNATVVAGSAQGSYKAQIDMNGLLFSDGASVRVVASGHSIAGEDITWNTMSAPEGVNMGGVRIIAVASQNEEFYNVYVKDVVFVNNTTTAPVVMNIAELDSAAGGHVAIYFLPLVETEGGNSTSYSDILNMMKNTDNIVRLSALVDLWASTQRGYVRSYVYLEQ